ncbi:MAG: phosphatidate cytidylyltransferase [Coriobacteriia bacterium]|nr:phosphatidate cytidylyltransferase [Coriobacteriia bacterium]
MSPDLTSIADDKAPPGITIPSLLLRLGTGLFYGAVMFAGFWFGTIPTGILLGVFAGAAAGEFYAMARADARLPNEIFGIATATSMPVAAALWGISGMTWVITVLVFGSLVWHVLYRRMRTVDTAITLLGAAYIGFLLGYFVLITRTFTAGRYMALVLLASVWAADVFAYLFGSLFGKHRLVPHISPKKSWEGFAAGTIATIGVWVASVCLGIVPGLGISQGASLGFVVAVAALAGDLIESRIKREAGIKDSGSAFPGHGGFFDRVDSLILVGVVAYWAFTWMGMK